MLCNYLTFEVCVAENCFLIAYLTLIPTLSKLQEAIEFHKAVHYFVTKAKVNRPKYDS